MRAPKRVLLSRVDNIGDVVLTLPMVQILKRSIPQCKIFFLGQAYVRDVVAACQAVDQFVDWTLLREQSDQALIQILKSLQLDVFIHVLPQRRLARLAKLAKIPQRIGVWNRWYHWVTCNIKRYIPRSRAPLHEAQANAKLLAPILGRADWSLAELRRFSQLRVPRDETGPWQPNRDQQRFYLIMHPGSHGHGREWPVSSYVALIKALADDPITVILTGSEAEQARFHECFPKQDNVVDLMGQLTLKQLMVLIAQSDGLLASGTGPLHLAAAFGIHVLGLFPARHNISPTRWGPLGLKAQAMVTNQPCPGCTQQTECACMRALSVCAVRARVVAWMETASWHQSPEP